MIHTQSEIDNLVELAIIQRAELKKLVDSLPQLRDHLSSEIERNLEEIEPAIRSELEQFVTARALDAHAQTSTALTAKIDELARSLESTTAARYSVLIAEREKNASLLAQAEARIAEAASALPISVAGMVTEQLARFPRAGEIDQLRKEFAEPKGLNPRGKWQIGETYYKLDLVSYAGDSYVANEETTQKPTRTSKSWTLLAARGAAGSGNTVSIQELTGVPADGQLLIGSNGNFIPANLTAGDGIAIDTAAGFIEISADGATNYQGTWNAATNSPTLASSVGTKGHYYVVSVDGSTNLNGVTDWKVGDWAIYNGTEWQKVDNTDSVFSVFGRNGAVVATVGDYTASQISNVAGGSITATDVQAAINELDAEKAANGANADITSMSAITGGISSPDFIQFDTTASASTTVGKLFWNDDDGAGTLSFGLKGGNVTANIGQIQFYRVKASATITKGQVIMITGVVGNSGQITGAPASGLLPNQGNYVLGVAAESGASNDWVAVYTFGFIRGIDTTGGLESWAANTVLYFNPSVSGGLTKNIPIAPNPRVEIASVVIADSTVGELLIRITNGNALGETDSNVQITSVTGNDFLVYDSLDQRWENYNPASARAALSLGTLAVQNASGVTITGGAINGTAIGGSTPAAGSFTTLSSNSTTTLNGTTIPASKTLVVTTDKLSALSATTSAELAGVISDETGSGALVFATSPTLVTPALGIPSSATLTNATGLPVSSGISGLGTGVATALAVNVGSAGALVVNGGALGTPSSGTVTNLTGTASININGTVGATTPSTGAFTTLTASGLTTITSSGTAGEPSVVLQGNNNSERIAIRAASYDGNVNSGSAVYLASTSRGTISSPTAVLAGDNLGYYQLGGYNGTTWTRGAWISGTAAENWSNTNRGSNLILSTTPNGSTTIAERMRIDSSGNVLIGTTTNSSNGILQLTSHTTSAGGIGFGTDVTLYRSAANVLKTDDDLVVAGALASTGAISSGDNITTTATTPFIVGTSGTTGIIYYGSVGAASPVKTLVNNTVVTDVTSAGLAVTGALSSTGALAIGNTVNTVSPTSPNRTVTIVIGGTTYYLHAKTTND